MAPTLTADVATVVLVGNFRPVKISPKWLYDQAQISDLEFSESTIELLIPDEATSFQAGWLRCVANPNQLQFETSQESEFERMRDLAVSCIRAMPDIELGSMGINRIVHFEAPTAKGWHAVGDNLVRNDVMNNVLHLSGMRNVTYWGVRTDHYGGRVQVQVEPSFRFPKNVFVTYNDHYDLTYVEKQPKTRAELDKKATVEDPSPSKAKNPIAIEVLNENWNSSMRKFNDVLDTIWHQAKGN